MISPAAVGQLAGVPMMFQFSRKNDSLYLLEQVFLEH